MQVSGYLMAAFCHYSDTKNPIYKKNSDVGGDEKLIIKNSQHWRAMGAGINLVSCSLKETKLLGIKPGVQITRQIFWVI